MEHLLFLCYVLNKRTSMQTLMKIIISLAIIFIATAISKKLPSTAGLIGVMPIAGALVLVWVYVENKGDAQIMQSFTKGALWGIIPSLIFYLVALFCFRKQLPLSITLSASFAAWLAAAFIHYLLLK
jgi:uncharacterized membrane protein (GlpM family)